MTDETRVAMEMTFDAPGATDEQFEDFLDSVSDELVAIGCEHQLAARIADRYAEFSVTLPDSDFLSVTAKLLGDFRTALHAAGVATPGWPRFQLRDQSVRQLTDA